MSGDATRFSSRRAIAPMMWTLLAIALCELAVVHFLIALWSPVGALTVSALTVPALVWLVVAIRSLATTPGTIHGDSVILCAGRMRGVTVAVAGIAGLRGEPTRDEVRAGDMLNLAMLAHPNVVVDLSAPVVRRGRTYRAIAHRLDDPAAFVAALSRLGVRA